MTSSHATSAITAMWAWDNSISPADDDRGRGYAPAAPSRLAAFARAGELREVFLAVPAAAQQGPVGAWFRQACDALQSAGVELSAVGGAGSWLREPELFDAWLEDTQAAGVVDRVHLDLRPWAQRSWTQDSSAAMDGYLAFLDAARRSAGTLPLDVDAPWWLAHESHPDPTGTPGTPSTASMLDAVLARVDRVSILAYADRATGPGGILGYVARAVTACVRAGRPFTIAVETDTPELSGGPEHTFFDEGPVALLREAALVRASLEGMPGYRGVAVAHHRAWRRLLGV